MILHAIWERLMIKRPTVASSQTGRWRKRRSSAVRTLVVETLVLAKTHGYVEKIEDELERELQRDIRDPPEEKIHRWRRKGDAIFKSKHVLLTVVIMCIADCALVLGELALDLYKVKATLEDSDKLTNVTEHFLSEIVVYHPILINRSVSDIYSMLLDAQIAWPKSPDNSTDRDNFADMPIGLLCPDGRTYKCTTLEDPAKLPNVTERFFSEIVVYHPILNNRSVSDIYSMLLDAHIAWPKSPDNSTDGNNFADISIGSLCPGGRSSINMTDFWIREQSVRETTNSSFFTEKVDSFAHLKSDVELIGKIAHIFHYCSIALLTLILIETICKAICAGRSFFHRKIEVFDALVVLISFFLDFSFLVFLPDIDTKDFVFILAILLPWRVIRVVDSLIVSVKDHEHFRLKLVYKRKKKIQGNLRDTEVMLQKYMMQVTALQRLCIEEGIDEWKIDTYLKNEECSLPTTPAKRKFKFKLDDSIFNMQGHNRGPRCSLPVLDFQGLKFPSRSRISLPGVAQTIKHHISKNLPGTRRASFAAVELHATRYSNGDLRRRKLASDDLCTMHEEKSENEDSPTLSRATSESGDVFSRVSVSESLDSDRTLEDSVSRIRNDSGSTDEEADTMVKTTAFAKRCHSESTIDRNNVSVNFNDITPTGKTITKPQKSANGYAVSGSKSKCDATNTAITIYHETTVSIVDETDTGCTTKIVPLSTSSNEITENNNQPNKSDNACNRTNNHCNGNAISIKEADNT